jgi:hypothetical protein
MKLIVPVILALGLFTPTIFADGVKNYKNFSIGIQVDYPRDWSYSESKGYPFVFFLPSNDSQPNTAPIDQKVYLLMARDTTISSGDIPPEKYLKYAMMQLQNRKAILGLANRTLLAGEAAYQLFYTNKNGNKGELFVVVHNDSPYTISFVAPSNKFSQYLPVIQNIISSLKFI